MVQPASIDVRLDRWFRVFNNHRYTHIDPAQQQDELTTLVEKTDGEAFVLHPGEFVLASTFEAFTLLLQSARQLFTLVDCIALPKLSAEAGKRPQWTFTVIGAMPNDAVDSTFAGQTLDFSAAPSFKGQATSIGAFTSATNGPSGCDG